MRDGVVAQTSVVTFRRGTQMLEVYVTPVREPLSRIRRSTSAVRGRFHPDSAHQTSVAPPEPLLPSFPLAACEKEGPASVTLITVRSRSRILHRQLVAEATESCHFLGIRAVASICARLKRSSSHPFAVLFHEFVLALFCVSTPEYILDDAVRAHLVSSEVFDCMARKLTEESIHSLLPRDGVVCPVM
jgi:hypothetical protein